MMMMMMMMVISLNSYIHTTGNDLYYEMIEGGVIKVDKATGKDIDRRLYA